MQLCVNSIQNWVSKNGFKFLPSKTVCIHFCRQNRIFPEPTILLDKSIKMFKEAKFLGLIFYSKLTFKNHMIQHLKISCQKALDILRVVGHTDWGADRTVLLRLYRSLVCSKFEYGPIVYGRLQSLLKEMDPIHHQGLRIALGAFRTSPVQSLYVEAHEPSLSSRRLILSLNYVVGNVLAKVGPLGSADLSHA